MSLSFRVRRRAGTVTDTGPASVDSLIDDLFRSWSVATSNLRAAEARRDDHDTILALAVEVIRARNALTREQIALGWSPSAAILRELTLDEMLVQEADDRAP
ncbi:MAG: hypothetical protein QOJ62_2818 [Actinomycetota bacterium]|nr:hypothetical protein [Actinomycetota bacterium]